MNTYIILLPAPGYYKGSNTAQVHIGLVSSLIGITIGLVLLWALIFKNGDSINKNN